MACHHSNSRRFKCACGKTHVWGHTLHDNGVWEPHYHLVCPCGRTHTRGVYGPASRGAPCNGDNLAH